ncbi:galactitol-1-phosphate 5-dehydrogenase [Lachnospiraceae bacterium 62-35]
MKAWVLHDIGDIRLESVKDPALKEGEVLVAVKAAGICGSDIPRIYRTGAYSYPLIPGHEFSGIVVDGKKAVRAGEAGIGSDMGTEKRWLGKRVGIFPLIPCNTCLPCRKKQYEMCRHYSYLGSRRDGGFAEYVAVPADNLLELPDSVSFEEAAMLEPMAVAVHAMKKAMLEEGTAVVCGLGTIGLLLVMFLQEAGVKDLLVIGNKEFQRQTVLTMGLPEDCYCDSRSQNVDQWLMKQTDGQGADIFFECVGKNETFMQAINSTAPAGRVCLVGNPYSDMLLNRNVYWKILRNQLTVLGTWNSSFTHEAGDDWHYALDRLSKKKICPSQLISHRFSLKEEMEKGFQIMRDKTEDYIKIMGIEENLTMAK